MYLFFLCFCISAYFWAQMVQTADISVVGWEKSLERASQSLSPGYGLSQPLWWLFCKLSIKWVLKKMMYVAISSDLYRPQFWDGIFNFPSMLFCHVNLTCNWVGFDEKIEVRLKLFSHFVLTFVNLMSGHEIWDFSRFTCLTVYERRKVHFVTHIFITDNNSKF